MSDSTVDRSKCGKYPESAGGVLFQRRPERVRAEQYDGSFSEALRLARQYKPWVVVERVVAKEGEHLLIAMSRWDWEWTVRPGDFLVIAESGEACAWTPEDFAHHYKLVND